MSIANLTFESVGQRDRLGFAKALTNANIFARDSRKHTRIRPDLSGLTVSFSKAGFFQAPHLATLAAILRRIAEKGKPVTINWPRSSRGHPSELGIYLERLRFAQLFERETGIDDWRQRIRISDREELEHYPPDPHETTHYIPLRWFDKSDFLLIGSASIYKERPIVKPAIERDMHSVLLQQGFADIETIDVLNRVLFLELAFNAVLHAGESPGSGSGVFCAQIRHQEKQPSSITFCIADAGHGIPFTLRAAFEKAVSNGEYYPDDNKTAFSNIVRFAFENNSSSRPEFPSGTDEESTRGLALVAESLSGRGDLAIISDGACLRVKGTSQEDVNFQTDDDFRNCPIIGTQIIGTLRSRVPAKKTTSRISNIPTLTRFAVAQCCDPNGYCSVLASADSAKAYAGSVNAIERVLIFDLGFGESGIRHLEYLCRNALPKFRDKLLIFWNISTEWNQFEALSQWIRENLGATQPPPLFVREAGDARVLGHVGDERSSPPEWARQPFMWYADLLHNNHNNASSTILSVGWPVAISIDDYIQISRRVNSDLLADGFRRADTTSGFFTGSIHLLSTRNTTKYFAIAAHISAGVDANLKRWISGSVAGIIKLAEQTTQDLNKPIVILAFAGPMRHVLAHVPPRLPMKSRGYTLLTYDVPTHEEISSYVHPGDEVILLTDVVSTGSLLGAVASSVVESSAKILGIVSLINYRQDGNAHIDSIKLGRENVRFCALADFPRAREGEQYLLSDKQYWVDPVTLIPQSSRPWGWADVLDPRIENTLSLLMESEAVRCGHVVDGPRHTSAYVDVKALLAVDTGEIIKQVRSICHQRLERRGWTEFSPSVILYPTGIRRIEAVDLSMEGASTGGASDLTAYSTAAKLFSARVKDVWGKNICLGEVPRAFDPGGIARCSEQVFFQDGIIPDNIEWNDVIIADDGMWRGITSTALIRIAVTHGAKRILVIPLLTRMTPREAETWENICSVEGLSGSPPAQVCFALPFILPIPSYSALECPYEQTQRRFRDREWISETVRQLADSVSATLNGRHPGETTTHGPSFLCTWFRLRTYAELASENEMALEKLAQLVETIREANDLLALFALFLEEWRLLGKARLRQTIASRVKQRAQQALRANHDGAIKAAALSLLRSQFTDDFFPSLAVIADSALKDVSLLGRAVLHIATLPARERASDECLRFLELIQDKGPASATNAGLQDKDLAHYMELVGACGAISLQSQVQSESARLSPRQAAIKAIDFITNDPVLRHDVRPFINPFAERGETLREISARTFELHSKDWRIHHRGFLTKHILPMLEVLRPCLLHMSTHKHFNPSHIQYLTSSRHGTRQLTEDFAQITTALDFLAMETGSKIPIYTLTKAAERLSLHLINENSTLLELLHYLKGPTVDDFVSNYRERITEHLKIVFGSSVDVKVTIEGLTNVDATRNLFVPPEELEACTAHILHNLETKAFAHMPAQGEQSIQHTLKIVLLVAETRNNDHDLCLSLTVKNNGAELGAGVELGVRGKRIARHIQYFGGAHEGPIPIEEHPWRVAQRMFVCLW